MGPSKEEWRIYEIENSPIEHIAPQQPPMVDYSLKDGHKMHVRLIEGKKLPPPPPAINYILDDSSFVPTLDYEEVADRIKCLSEGKQISLEFNKTIFSFVDFFTRRRRDYTQMMVARQDYYFPTFERILAKHNMPDELKYLSIVESGLNPVAKSRVGAAGLLAIYALYRQRGRFATRCFYR